MPRSPLAVHWDLDPAIVFLNHGSFGATPRRVLTAQHALRARMESEPVRFFVREMEPLLDRAREALGALIHADPEGLVFVNNATTGVNTVLASLPLRAGDELLVTDHEYAACRNALDETARRTGARVVCVSLPFPVRDANEVLDAIVAGITPRTRLLLVDHVTSPSALVLPIDAIVHAARERGVDALVDGAHAVGMVPLDLEALAPAYYTGNLHKWLCTPKGSAFLWAHREGRDALRPLVISHGATTRRVDRARFRLEFDWTGTDDPTAVMCIPEAIAFFDDVVGGIDRAMARNRALALEARQIVGNALRVASCAPESMIGSMAAIVVPPSDEPPIPPLFVDPLQEALFAQGIEVPVMPVPAHRVVRVSAQLYNDAREYRVLADALHALLSAAPGT
jgi:isopenicillin-N epimerase